MLYLHYGKILFNIGYHGEPGERPKYPTGGSRVDVAEYDIQNLSRCCYRLVHDVERLESDVAELRSELKALRGEQ